MEFVQRRACMVEANNRTRLGFALVAGVLSVAALTGFKSQNAKAAAPPAAPLVTGETVEIRARVTGNIEKWLFKPGAQVTAGQVLYVLDRRPYEASVTQAKGNL